MEGILFVGLFVAVGVINIAGLALVIWAIVDVMKNPSLDDTQRIIWILVILCLNCAGAIAYLIAGRNAASPPDTGSGMR